MNPESELLEKDPSSGLQNHAQRGRSWLPPVDVPSNVQRESLPNLRHASPMNASMGGFLTTIVRPASVERFGRL